MTVTSIATVRRLDIPTPAMAAGTPSMRCPRCETATLHERARNGVFVDTCPRCHGVWLDRGELEKILLRATPLPPGAEGKVLHFRLDRFA